MLPCAMMSVNWEDGSKVVKCVCLVDLKGECGCKRECEGSAEERRHEGCWSRNERRGVGWIFICSFARIRGEESEEGKKGEDKKNEAMG